MTGPKLVIKQQQSALWYAMWVTLGVLLLFLSFYVGRFLAIDEQQQTIDKAHWLQQKLDEYQQAYQQANQDLVMQTQSSKVDNQSSQQLVDTIKQLQATQLQLEAELKFYRNIMAPELSEEGLTIAEFEIAKTATNQASQFKLVLTQAGKQDQFLKGNVELNLLGTINGKAAKFKFSELGTFQRNHFEFQFRYFQNIEGEINLPQGFVANRVSVVARTKGLKQNQTAEKQFDWNR